MNLTVTRTRNPSYVRTGAVALRDAVLIGLALLLLFACYLPLASR
jgi:hypothetical protein